MSVKLRIALGVACVGAVIAIACFVVRLWPVPGWTHDPTGLVFPGQVAGMKRIKVDFWPKDEAYGILKYQSPFGGHSEATIRIYRSALPKSSIWSEIFLRLNNKGDMPDQDLMPVILSGKSGPSGLMVFSDDEPWHYEEGGGRRGSLFSHLTAGDWRIEIFMSSYSGDGEPTNVLKPFYAFIQSIDGLPQVASLFSDRSISTCRASLEFEEAHPADIEVDGHAFLRSVAPKLLSLPRPLCREEVEVPEDETQEYWVYRWDNELEGYSALFHSDQYAVHVLKLHPGRDDSQYAVVLITPNQVHLMKVYDKMPRPENVTLANLGIVVGWHKVDEALASISRTSLN